MTSLSKFQGRTVNYGNVRADEISENSNVYKRDILHAQSMKITQNAKFKMYHGCLCIDFSVSQSIDESIRVVYRTYCMSLRQFYTPQCRNIFHLYMVIILFFCGGCVYIILHHGTLEILQLCHLGICMYTMEAHTGLTILPYT